MNFENGEQPLLVGGINYEIANYEKMEFVLEEFAEGILSYRTRELGEEFLKEIKNYITEEIFKEYLRKKKPFFYLVMNSDDMNVYIYCDEFIKGIYEYKSHEDRLVSSVIQDLS